jgi:DNA/RNA endonuclease YhcR with UshA esterase domain
MQADLIPRRCIACLDINELDWRQALVEGHTVRVDGRVPLTQGHLELQTNQNQGEVLARGCYSQRSATLLENVTALDGNNYVMST